MKRCLLALLGAGLVIACRNEPRSTTPAVFALPVAPIGHRVEVTEVPTPDELLAWQAAPTCPPPTVLVRHEGGSLGCYDEATALPHGPFVSRNERFVGSTGWYFDGKKDGTWTSYYSSEPQLVIEQGQWDHGVKVGLWRAWDMQREFTSSWLFDDEGTGLDQRWYDGHLSEQVPLQRGCPHGKWQRFDEHGAEVSHAWMAEGTGTYRWEYDALYDRTEVTWEDCEQVRADTYRHGTLWRSMEYERGLPSRELVYAGDTLLSDTDRTAARRADVDRALADPAR